MSEQSNAPKKNYLIEDYQPFKSVNWSGECEHIERDKNMNQSKTPRSTSIRDNIHVAMVADNREQSISHLEEAHREIESMERELIVACAEISHMVCENGNMYLEVFIARNQRDRLAELLSSLLPYMNSLIANDAHNQAQSILQSLTTNEQ
jgi:hypothetical protein